MVVIDEQHKFGVAQRAFFAQHGHPHIIQMSATPIPRSMALAVFGECEVSVIDELPAGRKPISTKITTPNDYPKIIPWIYDKVCQGQKVFVVVSLIQESDQMDGVHDLMTAYDEMQALCDRHEFDAIKIGILHGKMKPKEKDAIMHQFHI